MARTEASAKSTGGKKAAAKQTPAAAPAKAAKATTKKATSKKATSKQTSAATKAPAAKKAPAKKAAETPAKKAPAKKAPATKAPAAKTSVRSSGAAAARRLVVREDESPWTAKELTAVRAELEGEVERLREEIQLAEDDLVDLMRDPLDGAGDDEADAGAKSYERDQEITLTNNARAVLVQNLHALERLDDGTYGVCESCGNPIGKLRLQAYPRASLCVTCKSRQERR